jgi:hypothetical protein
MRHTPRSRARRRLALALSGWMLLLGALPSPGAQAPPTGLNINILEGEGAINNIKQRTAREPIVQVEDENHRPIAGAIVIFTLPDRGASGVFANGSRSMTVTTDAQGQARAVGLRPNNAEGQMQIQVSVSYQGLTASAVITQTNAAGGAGAAAGGGVGTGKIIALLAVLGGAAAGGIVAATRGGGSTSTTSTGPPPPTPTSVSAGPPSFGPPR